MAGEFWDLDYDYDQVKLPVGTRVRFKANGYDRVSSKVREGTEGTIIQYENDLALIMDKYYKAFVYYSHEYEILEEING